jgi:hypothetical protein
VIANGEFETGLIHGMSSQVFPPRWATPSIATTRRIALPPQKAVADDILDCE